MAQSTIYKLYGVISAIMAVVLEPVLIHLCLWKFGSVWNLKKHLQQQKTNPNALLLHCYDRYFRRLGSWIPHTVDFAGEPCFPHGPTGVFISGQAKIGRNAVIFQQVTIGSNTLNDSGRPGSPFIGDNVYIGAGAKIIGKISIGDNCRIGANAVVYRDLPPHSVAVQSPTRIIQRASLDNRYYSMHKDGKWRVFDDGKWIEDEGKTLE